MIWLLLLIFPYLLSYHETADYVRILKYSWIPMIFYAIIFYLNYFYLIDKILFDKKTFTFIIINLCFIAVCVWANYEIRQLITSLVPDKTPRVHKISVKFFIYKDIISMMIPIIISIATKATEKWIKTESEKAEKEKENLYSELQHLKYQLQPHFFFNSLNNIYSLVEISPGMAQEAIHSLAQLMRYMLYDADTGRTNLSAEIEFMKQYINLMKLRISEKTIVQANFDVPAGECKISPLLFISLIENAFKHGISATHPSEILFKLTLQNNNLIFTTENHNFPKTKDDKSGSGIGLNNLKKRLDLLYSAKYIFNTKIENDKYYTHLSIDIK
ncbi:MAG TPA: histidine kinase [Bacteroidia bacterium]|nr:histidine kinase [Bacteroidia bacterium]